MGVILLRLDCNYLQYEKIKICNEICLRIESLEDGSGKKNVKCVCRCIP